MKRGIQYNYCINSLLWACLIVQLFYSYELLNLVSLPAQAYSASLHPDKNVFVAGGEDFKIYKFAYDDGKELGMSLTLDGCIVFSCN